MDVWTYFEQKEREFDRLSVAPDRAPSQIFGEEVGSQGRRGRIIANLWLAENAFLAVSELVVAEDDHVTREEYGYFLVIDGDEVWGYERDPTHHPAVHRHGSDHERYPAEPISLARAVELAWEEVARRAEP